jgi:DNA-directed RNA polymerase specialized sigma24 family protein
MESTDGDAIEARLLAAQQGVKQEAAALYQERRDAALAAQAAGWSKYRIGKVLGVSPTTVDSILKTARRAD